ncbi:MAG: phosphocholine cytidylyltransferase family protein, partial [Gammaproteobacteria bacterium]|nr:phosphocholine cytidylyltransferase family protein [Gammaproteobacteria bacterium]
ELNGKTLLQRQLDTAHEAGVHDVVLIGGYLADQLRGFGAELVINEDYATTNMVQSLFCARSHFGNDFIMSYGDIVYGRAVLDNLLESQEQVAVVVDSGWRSYWERRFEDPLSDAESLQMDEQNRISSIGQKVRDISEIEAQYIGLVRFQRNGVRQLCRSYDSACEEKTGVDDMYMTDLLQAMASEPVGLAPVLIDGNWLEIDSVSDLELAERLLRQGRLH